MGLSWQDANLEAGTLSVRTSLQYLDGKFDLVEPKTSHSRRTIKIPAICVESLMAHRRLQHEERMLAGHEWNSRWDLVFTAAWGEPLGRSGVMHIFQRILAKTGMRKYRFHDLRHTCATLLHTQGVPLRVVMETFGHNQISTTADIYAHVLPVLMADAADRMDAALAEA